MFPDNEIFFYVQYQVNSEFPIIPPMEFSTFFFLIFWLFLPFPIARWHCYDVFWKVSFFSQHNRLNILFAYLNDSNILSVIIFIFHFLFLLFFFLSVFLFSDPFTMPTISVERYFVVICFTTKTTSAILQFLCRFLFV